MIPQEYHHLIGEDLDLDQANRYFADMEPDEQSEFLEFLQSQQAQQDEENGVGLTGSERINKWAVDPWTIPDEDDGFLKAGAKTVADTFLGSLPRFGGHLWDQFDDGFLDNADGVEAETGVDNVLDGIFSLPLIGGALKGVKGGVGLGGRALGGAKGIGNKLRSWTGFGPRNSYKAKTQLGSKLKRGAGLTATGGSFMYGGLNRPGGGAPDLDNPDGEANATVVDPQGGDGSETPGGASGQPGQPGMPAGHATFHPGTGGGGAPPGNPIMDDRMKQWLGARNYLSNMNQPDVRNTYKSKGKVSKLDAALGKEAPDLEDVAYLNYNGTLDHDNKRGMHHSMSHPINVKNVTRRGADNKRGTFREMNTGLQESMDIRNAIAHNNLMRNRHKVTQGYDGAFREFAKNNPDHGLDWDGNAEHRMRFVREIYPNIDKYNQTPPEPPKKPTPNLDSPAPDSDEDGDGISPWWLAPLAIPAAWGASKLFGRKGGQEIAKRVLGAGRTGSSGGRNLRITGSRGSTPLSGSGGGGVRPPNSGSGGGVRPLSGSGGGVRPLSGSGGGGVRPPNSGSGGGVRPVSGPGTRPSLDKIPDMKNIPGWGANTPKPPSWNGWELPGW